MPPEVPTIPLEAYTERHRNIRQVTRTYIALGSIQFMRALLTTEANGLNFVAYDKMTGAVGAGIAVTAYAVGGLNNLFYKDHVAASNEGAQI